MIAYLDNNILVYIENGYFQLKELLDIVNPKIKQVFFSPYHIYEAIELKKCNNISRDERIYKRLTLIDTITDKNYLYLKLPEHEVKFLKESAFDVFQTINDTKHGISGMKFLLNIVKHLHKRQIRKALGLEKSRLNNYSSSEVIEHLNKSLSKADASLTILELIERAMKANKDYDSFGRSNRYGGLFELLDILGYWTDKESDKSNYARSMDAGHAFYASYCDYFITNDKRTRNKTKVAYDVYGVDTLIPELGLSKLING